MTRSASRPLQGIGTAISGTGFVVTMGAAHIRRIERASTRRIRQMTQTAITQACDRARDQGAQPLTAVDDLSVHTVGPWVETFAKCLARSAAREKISIVGGEMAQMSGSYAPGYAGIVVTVVSLRQGNNSWRNTRG